ncbi:MAG: translation initiation factor IF-2 [Candidatus Aminicenantes bacterium]|nr:translation initiation factor IF-2 [Candidatus Aminicenantes bacterium]
MSATIKLHEATKRFKLSNKLAMFFLEKIDMPVKSHSSVITVDQLESLRELSASAKKIAALEAEMKKGKAGKGASAAKAVPVEPKAPPAPKKTSAKKAAETKTAAKKASERKGAETKPPPAKPKARVAEAPAAAAPAVSRPPAPPKPAAPPRPTTPPRPATPPPVRPPVQQKPPAPAAPRPPAAPPDFRKAPPRAQESHTPRIFRPSRPPFRRSSGSGPRPRPQPRPAPPPAKEKMIESGPLPEKIQITDFCTVKELAERLDVKLKFLEEKIVEMKMDYQGNQIMDGADIEKLCADLGVAIEILPYEEFVFQTQVAKSKSQPAPRPPVVTVMGHVDHGKTTLLDTLRKTRVAEKEAGGITQRIGAYKLSTPEGDIVFIDTPGHEAFTNLRARGAKVTDLVILVVAANDGVQPQTVEAIHHAQAAQVPMIVAINKIDIAGSDRDRVKQDLNKHGILVEEWGGKVVSVEISAKMNQNLGALLEMIQLVAQMQELKAHAAIPARGTVIEARLDPQLGPLGTVLIQHGRLKKGDYFICGNSLGKIKSIFDDNGRVLDSAQVPDPVEIMGFETVPQAGDLFQVIDDLEKAKTIIRMRQSDQKATKSKDFLAEKRLNLQNLFQGIEADKAQVFPLVVKADHFGSVEVLEQILAGLGEEKLKIQVLHSGLGHITEGDILLASTAGAVIIGFNVKAPQKILAMAKMEKVEIRLYNVIYHLVEDMQKAVKGMIGPEYQETRIGEVEILQKFKISNVGIVAGCLVREGKVTRKSKVKVTRGGDLVFEGEIESLKRIKDEVSEVRAGTECGIRIRNFNGIEPGDILEVYETSIIP